MAALVATTAFADVTADQLVGHWQCAQESLVASYDIHRDGTFTGSLAHEGKVIWTSAGTWVLNGKTIRTRLTKSSTDKIPVGTKDQNTSVELTKDVCRLRLQNGTVLRYLRVP